MHFDPRAQRKVDPRSARGRVVDRRGPVLVREACAGTGVSRAQMQRYRNKSARPHAKHLEAIKQFLKERKSR